MSEIYKSQKVELDDAILLIKAASILRKYSIVKQEPFDGCFYTNCLSKPVPE